MRTLANPCDKAELVRRMRGVRPDSVPRWGRMSAHQMVCHLADAFRMGTGEKAVSLDTTLANRTIVRWVALYLPVHWPPGIRTRPEIDQECGGTRPVDFAADLARLEDILQFVTAEPQRLDQRVHPIFGRLSAAVWLRWGYRHVDHHLRQFGA